MLRYAPDWFQIGKTPWGDLCPMAHNTRVDVFNFEQFPAMHLTSMAEDYCQRTTYAQVRSTDI